MNQVQMQVPPMTRINKFIIIVHVGLFLLHSILAMSANFSLAGILGLSAAGVKSGFVFQFLTFPFVEVSFMGVLFNSLLIWFIGAELEAKWGEKFYLQFLAVSSLSAGLVYFIISMFAGSIFGSMPLMGLSGFTYALLLAYGIIYSERQLTFMLLFPMKAKYFCMLLAGIQLYLGIFSPAGKASWAHLTSMAIGFFFLKYRSLRSRGGVQQWKQEKHKKKMRSKLKLVKDDEEKADPKNPRYWQ
jgi:membrane associated rhomboid family serine protease